MKIKALKKGQSLVEFAIILPAFIILVIGVIDFGRYMLDYSILDNAVREATRFAVVQPNGAITTDKVRSYAYNIPDCRTITTKCTITINNPPPPTNKIRIQISYLYRPITPLLNLIFNTLPINVQSEMFLTPFAR